MQSATAAPIQTERLFVLYDTGETVNLLPVMADLAKQGKDFKFISVGSSVNSLKPATIGGDIGLFESIMSHRVTFENLEIPDQIDPTNWPRTKRLSKEGKLKIREGLAPKVVIVGVVSRVQKQFLKQFPQAQKIAFADNADYDTSEKNFEVVHKICDVANQILCPTAHTSTQLSEKFSKKDPHTFTVVGKPSIETWIASVNAAKSHSAEILQKLGLTSDKPIVVLLGGYDNPPSTTYQDSINPFYENAKESLQKLGYQVVLQPHPKVAPQLATTPELISIASCLVGYNSSVLYDCQLLRKNAIYLIPPDMTTKPHFSIGKGYADSVKIGQEKNPSEIPPSFFTRLEYFCQQSDAEKPDFFEVEKIPRNSIKKIEEIIDKALQKN